MHGDDVIELTSCAAVVFPPTPVCLSDHSSVIVVLSLPKASGLRPWRLDVRVLLDEFTKRTLSNLLKQSLVRMRPTAATWDHLKGRWRDLCPMQWTASSSGPSSAPSGYNSPHTHCPQGWCCHLSNANVPGRNFSNATSACSTLLQRLPRILG
ncbi:uncharacterized protein ISCGN_026159 [Ixodes scapularis]